MVLDGFFPMCQGHLVLQQDAYASMFLRVFEILPLVGVEGNGILLEQILNTRFSVYLSFGQVGRANRVEATWLTLKCRPRRPGTEPLGFEDEIVESPCVQTGNLPPYALSNHPFLRELACPLPKRPPERVRDS